MAKKPPTAKKARRPNGGGNGLLPSERELIMVAKPEADIRARAGEMASLANADLSEMQSAMGAAGAICKPLFGDSEERVREAMASMPSVDGADADLPDFSLYYRVEVDEVKMDGLAKKLVGMPMVDAAYVKEAAQPAAVAEAVAGTPGAVEGTINEMMPVAGETPPTTPDFVSRQDYLDSAPVGVDARYAWTLPGGRGGNVRVVDIEGAWRFTHEDLRQNQGGVVGTPSTSLGWRNHGTAVVGVIGGDRNNLGIAGICPDTHVRGVSIFGGLGSAGAIRKAADLLRSGDIILIELHRPGPNATGQGQFGYIAMEWWPDDYAAIRYAVNRGVIVVEAAGNGSQNLDASVYNNKPAGFPADWKNPFNRLQRDSGAILVGAGAPPPGTHGRNHGPDRSRLGFSNYGSAVDAQGWGREVTSTGYGDLQGGTSEDAWYTDQFSGTSSASPIIVGAVGCVQGVLRARRRIPLSPARARNLLRVTGSPQQDASGRPRSQRIGNRPNLRQLIQRALYSDRWVGVQFTGALPANAQRRWFTLNWPAHWVVDWTVVPVTPHRGGPQISWDVQVERASDRQITYWITITNHSSEPTNIEARYAVLGW